MNKRLLSIILLSYYSGDKIAPVYYKIKELLGKEEIDFEFVIVDDGSKDRSFEMAKSLESKEYNVGAYRLSRNYTSNYAAFAGLSLCKGDSAAAIPDDGQLPYETIVKMFRLWEDGHKIILPYRISREDSFLNRAFSNLFYYAMDRLSEIKYPPGGADAFLIDREIIDIINARIRPLHTAVVPELIRLGFEPYFLPYSRPHGDTERSRWSFNKKVALAKDIFFSGSSLPIRVISRTGVFFSCFAFFLMVLYIIMRVFGNRSFWVYFVPGWTSIVVFISFFSGLILLALGIIAEYIWRIYEEVKSRPGYIIRRD